MSPRTFGVEEEFLLVDPETGRPRPIAAAMLHGPTGGTRPGFEPEMQLQQIETATNPCVSLTEVLDGLAKARRATSQAAREHGADLAALGTSPVPASPTVSPSRRYRRMAERFGLTAEEQLTCGCHVHVAIDSDEEGVGVLDRVRPWLAVLLALSTNSPFWQGANSSYASYRAQVWTRWPSSGPTELFGSAEAYHRTVATLVDTDTIMDEAMVYFDARLARDYPTVEVRVPDVCMYLSDAALLAVLARALVDSAARAWAAGTPAPPVRTEVLKLATWRASRSGLDGSLLHPSTQRPVPARAAVDALMEHVRPSLEESGEVKDAQQLLDDLFERGTGARRQLATYQRRGHLEDVVTDAIVRSAAQ